MKLLVKSCIFGFGSLTIISYLISNCPYLYIGSFISMVSGVLCHHTEKKSYCDIDKILVFSIGSVNIIDFITYYPYFTIEIILLINLLLIFKTYFNNSKFIKQTHFVYIHLNSYLIIFFLILSKYYFSK